MLFSVSSQSSLVLFNHFLLTQLLLPLLLQLLPFQLLSLRRLLLQLSSTRHRFFTNEPFPRKQQLRRSIKYAD